MILFVASKIAISICKRCPPMYLYTHHTVIILALWCDSRVNSMLLQWIHIRIGIFFLSGIFIEVEHKITSYSFGYKKKTVIFILHKNIYTCGHYFNEKCIYDSIIHWYAGLNRRCIYIARVQTFYLYKIYFSLQSIESTIAFYKLKNIYTIHTYTYYTCNEFILDTYIY